MAFESDARRHCPRCGAQVPVGAPAGVCPQCELQGAMDVLSAPSSDVAGGEDPGELTELAAPVRQFGDYELLEEIARGGMGVVYRARQRSLDRIVAVKMLLSGPLASREFIQRFRTEAAAAASLQHPNIVAIHEVGFHAGQHFFAMDFVAGRTLAEVIGNQPLPAKRAAGYLKTVAEAVHYAHEHGILHRDLKPSNVIIDADDQPRITDFGLAKRVSGDTEATLSAQTLGSPNYMPPEQAATDHGKVSRRSDVYALGAMLYHALTCRPPFVGGTLAETLQALLNTEPVRPRLLMPSVPADLETICLKCLEKDSTRRYRTAKELAEELARFLNGEPILARPISRTARVWRLCRRKPGLAVFGAATALLLLTVAIGAPIAAYRIDRARQWAEENRRLADWRLYSADVNLAFQALDRDNVGGARAVLEAHRCDPAEWRGFEWRLLWRRCQGAQEATLSSPGVVHRKISFSRDGRLLVLSEQYADDVVVYDLATRQLLSKLPFEERSAPIGFLPGSGVIALIATGASGRGPPVLIVLDGTDGRPLRTHPIQGYALAPLGLLADGRTFATTDRQSLIVFWDVADGRQTFALPGRGGMFWPATGRSYVSVSLTPDGTKLVHAEAEPEGGLARSLAVWDVAGRRLVKRIAHDPIPPITVLQISPDGNTLALALSTGSLILVNLADDEGALWPSRPADAPTRTIHAHTATIMDVAFAEDGRTFATASADQTVKLWDTATGRRIETYHGHTSEVGDVAFLPGGQTLASTADDATLRLWPVRRAGERDRVSGFWVDRRNMPCLSPDGSLLAAGCDDGFVRILDTASLRPRAVRYPGRVALGFGPDGQTLLTGDTNALTRCRLATGEVLQRTPLSPPITNLFSWAVSPDGRLLAYVFWGEHGLRVLDTTSGAVLHNEPDGGHYRPEFSPDGRLLTATTWNGNVRLLDPVTFKARAFVPRSWVDSEVVIDIDFSHDGRLLAAGDAVNHAKLWDAKSHELLATFVGHRQVVTAVAFSPDGRVLASGCEDGEIKLWSIPLRRELATLRFHDAEPAEPGRFGGIGWLAFTPDGNALVAAGFDGSIRAWRAATEEEIAKAEQK